jgi:hypothetical protein
MNAQLTTQELLMVNFLMTRKSILETQDSISKLEDMLRQQRSVLENKQAKLERIEEYQKGTLSFSKSDLLNLGC